MHTMPPNPAAADRSASTTDAAPTTTSKAAATTPTADMAPLSTLDVFILTFNCAKSLVNPTVFAAHLHGALAGQNGNGSSIALPDLVVFSLQEVAPLSYSFIGSYFLNPYYARFTEALNLASTWALGHGDAPTTAAASSSSPSSPDNSAAMARPSSDSPPYTLVRAKNVGMTAMLLYARDPTAVTAIAEAECGFGAADMGNKGAVGLRVTWKDGGGGGGGGGGAAAAAGVLVVVGTGGGSGVSMKTCG
ncbi:hypothetical protein VTJ49DRAFT_5577 [Mycothermus thermophilus]|uniref:Inositol polyphosphate-related phosphatase domain-containing protein n=1 Tax=Humicola insolens TaxID=85995 RepID=A0ABR3V2U4_HUMIN